MPDSEVILIITIPAIIIPAIPYVLIFDFSKFFKINRIRKTIAIISHRHIRISNPPALHASGTGSTDIKTAANPPNAA